MDKRSLTHLLKLSLFKSHHSRSSKMPLKITLMFILLTLTQATLIQKAIGSCQFNGKTFAHNANWQIDCKNCTCHNSVPICQQIQCKYSPCDQDKIFVLNENQCCPSCEMAKKSCHYETYQIEHNTEFSPKLCEVCKCKNGIMECINNCDNKIDVSNKIDPFSNLIESTSLNQRQQRLKNHHRKHKPRHNRKFIKLKSEHSVSNKKNPCVHDGKVYHFNAVWSPLKCTQCRCNIDSQVDCYVKDCPTLDSCQNGIELRDNDCCPVCKKESKCTDNGLVYTNGDIWTKQSEPCVHCTCINDKIVCHTERCENKTCKHNEILVSKSNSCCPKCVSQVSDNCEYNGRVHYNGEMWYNNGCEHCACDFGKVMCMNVQCESQFCLQDEIMVKKKDECCIQCRKPTYCFIDNNLKIKENEFWSPHNATKILSMPGINDEKTCQLCQCLNGHLECYSKSCKDSKFPSYAHVKVKLATKVEINAQTIPFFADILKSLDKESNVFITSAPMYSELKVNGHEISEFRLANIFDSELYYEINTMPNEEDEISSRLFDYAVLSIVSSDTGSVHNVLIAFEILSDNVNPESSYLNNYQRYLRNPKDNDRIIRGYMYQNNYVDHRNLVKAAPRKTIFVHPGEAIMLTSNELKPKNLTSNINEENLIYYLVSGNLRYGDLKLKKVISYDDNTPIGWNIVNDIYLEKKVTEFTQLDLDSGNVWYEPFSDMKSSTSNLPGNNMHNIDSGCLFGGYDCEPILSFSSVTPGSKYDHCMFEVYDQEKLDQLISKEIIHFNIQNDVINETVLGLEVIENQLTPLTFSNFDIAGIDSSRLYLIYRVIKKLDKHQGQLEHSDNPGVSIETFSQKDLNNGHILYHSPKEIGTHTKEYSFTFIVTNDNRSDTFPETPFHIKVSPANDQAPKFKKPIIDLEIAQSGSLALSREFFSVEDPDTVIDNMVFTVEKVAENVIIELRARGQRYLISKDDSFTMQEIRDGTFRLIHNGRLDSLIETLKISVSDGKHVTMKTINLNIRQTDVIAPHLANKHTTLILNVIEGESKVIRRENMAFIDDKSSPNQIIYELIKLSGKLYLRNTLLTPHMKFTQADIDLKNLKYEASNEIGPSILTDRIYFDVSDQKGNLLRDQVLTVNIEPNDNQAPSVEVLQPVTVQEGGFLLLNETFIRIRDSDSFKEQLNLVIDSQPSFGFIENIKTGNELSSFPITDLISGQTVRYVQNDHENKEPKSDLFIFHVSDGVNDSPTYRFGINFEAINDEQPVALFEPLLVETNKRVYLSNSTFHIVDFDTSYEELEIFVAELPKHGILYLNDIPITNENIRFYYSDVINRYVSYSMTSDTSLGDEIKFRISDGKFTTVSKYFIMKSLSNTLKSEDNNSIQMQKNTGLQAIAGHILPITSKNLKAVHKTTSDRGDGFYSGNFENEASQKYNFLNTGEPEEKLTYTITEPPKFGKLQFRFQSFYEDLTGPYASLNRFTQKDINEGRVFYNHALNEPSGVTYMSFKVTDSDDNGLNDQRFIITVRGDKLPPVVILNKELRINEGKSGFLTKYELNVLDDDTPLENLHFYIITQPKLGYLENVNLPGKRINAFNYNDLIYNQIRYIHNGFNLNPELMANVKDLFKPDEKEDIFDIKISDGKNDASISVRVLIIDQNNKIPIVKSNTGFSVRLNELSRIELSPAELDIIDEDTNNENLKVIITNSPQYGSIEKRVSTEKLSNKKDMEDQHILINTNLNQTLNLILKFNNNSSDSEYEAVDEFTMADIKAGLISYHHQVKGVTFDRFGFVVYDGVNKLFKVENKAEQTSNVQIFNIDIDVNRNFKPVIEKNLGLDYLYQIDGLPGRLITKNELQIKDNDDFDSQLIIKIIEQPKYGILENKDKPRMNLVQFTQAEINDNKIYYVLKQKPTDDTITSDFFIFNIYDSDGNFLNDNRFEISWSVLSFELAEMNVMETGGKARVHIKKTGNLKQFSMVTCKTFSDSAKSNRDAKNFDYVQTLVRLEFNEDESYKACDVMIQRDLEIEPIESFYVVLEDPKYSMIGQNQKIKVNILDKIKETYVEFEKIAYEVQEFQRFISIPVVRVGDMNTEIEVECMIREGTAHRNLDFMPRNKMRQNYQSIRIPAGETYGFCDIEIIDDDVNEMETEVLTAVLINSVGSVKIGLKSEAQVSIIGPNDLQSNNCNSVYYTVSESSNKFLIDISREDSTLDLDSFEVLITTSQSTGEDIENYSKFHKQKQLNEIFEKYHKSLLNQNNEVIYQQKDLSNRNITLAKPNEDYLAINQILKFNRGEATKKIEVTILNDALIPIMEGLKMFTIEAKPIMNGNLVSQETACNFVNPDAFHVVIEDLIEDSISVGFDKTYITVKESDQLVSIPIIRNGDVSQPFSVICHTRHLTAINGKDFIGRYSLEKSRIYFSAGERIKECAIEIINDSIFEADEEFQVRLSDLRGPEDAKLNQFTTVLVKITNNEDAAVISLSKHIYETEEPSSSDTSIIKPVTVLRTGDLSRTTVVRISTSDDTATAGIDYKPKTETLTFLPGVSALDFDVEIFYDNEYELVESFSINLGPQDPISGVFGEIITANILIRDSNSLENSTLNDLKQDIKYSSKNTIHPFVFSLYDYLMNGKDSILEKVDYFARSDKPLICLHPCDSKSPNLIHDSNKKGCDQSNDALSIAYGWEISTQDEFGVYSNYVKLLDNTLFSYINQRVLEPMYFRHKFRVRCTTQLISPIQSLLRDNGSFPILKSNTIEILHVNDLNRTDLNRECSGKWKNRENKFMEQNSVISMQPLDKINDKKAFKENKLDVSFITNLQSISEPFIARADYISADFIKQNPYEIDLKYLNYVRLVIDVPFVEGSFPLISTRPLFNYRLLLNSESDYSSQHICSNFIGKNQEPLIKYGFLKDHSFKNISEYEKMSKEFRNDSTLNFYSNLDNRMCGWKFIAYYDISELTTNCQAQIISDSDIRDVNAEKSYLTIKIPIYVSYIYPSYQASWSSIEYKSEIDAFIIYKTTSLEEINHIDTYDFNHSDQNDWLIDSNQIRAPSSKINHEHFFSLVINKISMNQEGKLIVEFTSIPTFRGQFVKYHSSYKNYGFSSLIGPSDDMIDFDLDLIWSQYTYDYPEQTWRATSTSILNNYSGNYTLRLIACYAKQDSLFKYPFDCEPRTPVDYIIPIRMEQTMRPIPLKYTLDTTFVLTNSPESDPESSQLTPFDGYFRKGDSLYGKVIWNGNHNRKASYKLELEKVFICQTQSKQFIPFYDPDGEVFNKGPQFGCSKPHDSLKHRILALDRNTKSSNEFTSQLLEQATETSDGFKIDISSLFDLVNKSNSKSFEDHPWYIQVMYIITMSNSSVSKRSTNVYSLNNIYNNGTNMQTIRLTNKPVKYFEKIFQKQNSQYFSRNKVFSFKDVFLKFLLPIFILIVFILFTSVVLIFYRKSMTRNKFWNIRLTKRKLSEFPNPIESSTSTPEKNIYDNYENLMNLKEEEKKPLNKFQILLNTTRLYKKRVTKRAFNKSDEKSENVSGSNSTSGTLIASPLLDNNLESTKLGSLLEDSVQFKNQQSLNSSGNLSEKFKNFNYEYLKAPTGEFEHQMDNDKQFGETTEEEEGDRNTKLSFKSYNLKAFIQKMNSRKSNLKSIKRIHRSQLTSNYDNAIQSDHDSYQQNETTSQRPISMASHASSTTNNQTPSMTKCRNNYLYFNYNNNKMNYLNGDPANTSLTTNNLSGTLSSHKKDLIDSSLYLNQLAEQHQMTTASAKMFILSSPSHHQGINQQDALAVSSVASTASIPQHHHIQVSPSSTNVFTINNKLANRLSGTEV